MVEKKKNQKRKEEKKRRKRKEAEKMEKKMNAAYGKTMENLRNRINVKLLSNKKDYFKWRSKPN